MRFIFFYDNIHSGAHGSESHFNFQVLLFKKYIFKAIAAIDSDSFDGSEQSKLKAFWKGFTILGGIKNIWNSWAEVKISTLTGVWKKWILTLMDD